MIKKRILIIFFVLLLFSALDAISETKLSEKLLERWRWTSYDMKDGLPSGNIIGLAESRSKAIWTLSDQGLSYFDGFQWQTPHRFQFKKTNVFIRKFQDSSISIVKDGKLYIANKKDFYELKIKFNNITLDNIIEVSEDIDNGLYINAIIDGKINSLYYSLNSQKAQKLNTGDCNLEKLRESQQTFYIISNDLIGITFDKGFYIYKHGAFICNAVKTNAGKDPVSYGTLHYTHNKKAYVYIIKPHSEKGVWEIDLNTFNTSKRNINTDFENIVFFSTDTYLAYTGNNKFRVYENGDWTALPDHLNELDDQRAITLSSNNDLWLVTNSGISFCHLSSNKWRYIELSPSPHSGEINEVIKKSNGDICIATGDGLYIQNKYNSIYQFNKLSQISSLLTGLLEFNQNNLWMTSGKEFTGIKNLNNDKLESKISDNPELNSKNIHKLFKDSYGRVWILALNPIFDFESPSVFLYDKDKIISFNSSYGLPSSRYYSIVENSKREIYIGGLSGLFKFTGEKFQQITNPFASPNLEVFAMTCSKGDTIYFGGRHTLVFRMINDKVEQIKTLDSVNVRKIWGLTIDPFGGLWIATKNGVFRYKNDNVAVISKKQGMLRNFTWAMYIDSNYAYLGVNGSKLHILDLQDINLPAPRIVINRPFLQENFASFTWNIFPYFNEQPKELALIRYKIDDNEWSEWRNIDNIALPNLSSGNHVFYIQSQNFFGETNGEIISYKFYVPYPIYAQMEFIVPVVFSFILVISIFISYQRKKSLFISDLSALNSNMEALLSNTPDTLILLNDGGKIILFNKAAVENMRQYYASEIKIGKYLFSYINEHDRVEWRKFFNKALLGETIASQFSLKNSSNENYFESLYFPIFVKSKIVGVGVFLRQITERVELEKQLRASLREKDILLKEIHHRVKNNLLVVSNLLGLHTLGNIDEKTVETLENARSRILSMSLIHEKLYKIDNLEQIRFGDYAKNLLDSIKLSFLNVNADIKINIDAQIDMPLSSAMPCGLILNELAMNSFKYAFISREKGNINLKFDRDHKFYYFEYSDDGVGLPNNFNIEASNSLGMFLIKELSRNQLKGELEIFNNNGLTFKIKFAEKNVVDLISPIL